MNDARKEYADIIDHEHYVDPNHPQMSRLNRAAQFSPFAALTGYEDLINEAARLTDKQIELDESTKDEISRRLNVLLHMENGPVAEITYFVPDERKFGGTYDSAIGRITGFNEYSHLITLDTGTTLFLDDISDIQAKCFDGE